MRLATDVARLEEGSDVKSSDVGARKKTELYRAIYRLGELAVAMEDGLELPASLPTTTSSSRKRSAADALIDDARLTAPVPADGLEGDATGPEWQPLAPDDKLAPPLEALRLVPGTMAHAVGRNDFGLALVDGCGLGTAGDDRRRAAATAFDVAALGRALVRNTRLRAMVLPFCGLSNAHMVDLLSPCVSHGHRLGVTMLDLRNNSLTSASGDLLASALRLCPNLQRLRLHGNDVGERALEAVVRALPPSLTELSLSNCTNKTCEVLAATRVPLLLECSLIDGSVGDAGVAHLCAMLSRTADAALPAPCMAVLDVSGNAIGATGLAALEALIDSVPSLWWVLDRGNPCCHPDSASPWSSATLSAKARDKMRRLKPQAHPSVELHALLFRTQRFSSQVSLKLLAEVAACMASGADPLAPLQDGTPSALELAASHFPDNRVLQLLVKGRQPAALAQAASALLLRCPGASPDNVRVLLEAGADVKVHHDGVPLLVAWATHAWNRGRSLDEATWLLKFQLLLSARQMDVNAADGDGETALSVLARSSYVRVVEVLLRCGADPRKTDRSHGYNCAHWAAKYGQAPVLRVLVKHAPQLLDLRSVKGHDVLAVAKIHARAAVELELMCMVRQRARV